MCPILRTPCTWAPKCSNRQRCIFYPSKWHHFLMAVIIFLLLCTSSEPSTLWMQPGTRNPGNYVNLSRRIASSRAVVVFENEPVFFSSFDISSIIPGSSRRSNWIPSYHFVCLRSRYWKTWIFSFFPIKSLIWQIRFGSPDADTNSI